MVNFQTLKKVIEIFVLPWKSSFCQVNAPFKESLNEKSSSAIALNVKW